MNWRYSAVQSRQGADDFRSHHMRAVDFLEVQPINMPALSIVDQNGMLLACAQTLCAQYLASITVVS